MDLGLGEVLDKVEKNFGRPALLLLLGVVFLSVVTFCVRTIVNGAILPVYHYVKSLGSETSQSFADIIASFSFSFVAGGLGLWLAGHILLKMFIKHIEINVEHSKNNIKIVKKQQDRVDELLEIVSGDLETLEEINTKFRKMATILEARIEEQKIQAESLEREIDEKETD